MKKSSKLIISFLFALIFSMSAIFCGCNNSKSDNSATDNTTEKATQAQTVSPATEDTPSQPATWNYSKLKQKADSLSNDFDSIINKKKFRGTVYLSIGNDFEYIGTNGFSDKDKHINNSLNTSYRVASITKQFTAVAIMQLKEQNKLSLDDTIDKYYPEYKYGKKITVKNLLTMTSGLTDYFNNDTSGEDFSASQNKLYKKLSAKNSASKNKNEIMNWIFAQDLIFEPDTDYAYSNSSYFLLGDIIEKVSGKSYESYITEKLLKPTGMISSGFKETEALAKGYQNIYNSEYTLYPGVAYSAASLISNAPDLLKWIDALCSNSLITEESFAEMTTPYKENYGYGFMINNESVSHTGRIDKYNSIIMFTKDQSQIAIALSNYAQSEPQNIFRDIFNKLNPYCG